MEQTEVRRLKKALLQFVERAAGENAKPEEIAALPAVAEAFVYACESFYSD